MANAHDSTRATGSAGEATLLRAGGLRAAALGATSLACGSGRRTRLAERAGVRPLAGDDRRPLLRRRRRTCAATSPRDRRERRSRCASRVVDARAASRSRAPPSTSGTATPRGDYSGVQANGTDRAHIPARHPAHRRERASRLQDHLPRLVPGPRRAHPRQGPHGRQRRAHRPALLPRRRHRRRLQARAVPGARHPGHAERRRLDLPAAAGAARCSACVPPATATSGSISLGVRGS